MAKVKKKPDTLVIVESPSKAKTINKYLGDSYIIKSSVGHIIDLPKSRLAVDVENSFKPEYITIRGKASVLKDLKKAASSVSSVLLATDPDREGEAISWHLSNALSVKNGNIKRIEFNEITESAVKEAVEHPREINLNLVNAQQARRVLDRIVGYYISPILWKKVKKGLSAGRVQSVVLKVICDREKEIDAFTPEEYWTIDIIFDSEKGSFTGSLFAKGEEKIKISNEVEANEILDEVKPAEKIVKDVKVQERRRKPSAPYNTSKLQQDASSRLGFNSQKTMVVAQQLYEGVNVTGEGPTGLITYMRTDSVRISDSALQSLREFIASNYKPEYLPEKPVVYKTRKGAQDAHEAVRPTNVNLTPEKLKPDLTREQYRLYELIWKRFVSSQMTPEVSETTSAVISAGDYLFRASGSRVLFNGFTVVEKDSKSQKKSMPEVKTGDVLEALEYLPEKHFTSPPARYNDASLVKFLEESGIGRPSTYAPTVNTLIKRYYIVRSGKQLVPTVLGKIVNDIMTANFSALVSVDFTAEMESNLDRVEDAEINWSDMLSDFHAPFKKTVDNAYENIEEMKNILDEETDIECEKCGRMMMKKLGKFGFFLACPGFPECRNSKSLPLGKCPSCENGDIVKRSSKKGRGGFYGCSAYPECEFLTRDEPAGKECPRCGSLLFAKKIKGRGVKNFCHKDGCGFEVELLDEDQVN